MRKYLFILFLIFSSISSFADFYNTTPGGNAIVLEGGYKRKIILHANENIVDYVKSWYFYKGTIVGKTSNKYFVVFEKEATINFFDTEDAWLSYLQKHRLIPEIWTRWYNNDWTMMKIQKIFSKQYKDISDDPLQDAFMFFYWLFLLPFYLLIITIIGAIIIWITTKVWKDIKNKDQIKKMMLYVVGGLIVVALIVEKLLCMYPQSI